MMALTFPRDPFMELFLNGSWQDIMTSVRQSDPIKIVRGRGGEQGEVAPGTLTCKLHNSSGDFTTSNPMGQWFGKIGRGTSVRFGLTVAEDLFAGSASNSWGTATTGEVWVSTGGVGGSVLASDWQKAGGVATHSVPTTVAYRYSTLPVSYKNIEVANTTTVPITNITGGPIEPNNVMVRHNGSSTYYMTRVSIDASEVLTITILSIVAGVETQLATPVAVAGLVDASTNKNIRVKMQAEGQTIRAKVYTPGAEPVGWHVQVHDTAISAAGGVGVRNGVGSGNTNTKPIVFSNDNFEVRNLRFAGEIAELKPRWNTNHSDKWAELTASTVLRRLKQGRTPVKSTMRRAYLADNIDLPIQYWPCEEGADARLFTSAIDNQSLNITGPPFSQNASFSGFLSSSPIPQVNGSTWSGSVSAPVVASTKGQVRFFIGVPASGHAACALADIYLARPSTLFRWRLNYLVGGDLQLVCYNVTGGVVFTSATLSMGNLNGKLYRLGVGFTQNGGNVDWEVVRLDYATGFNGAVGPTGQAGTFTRIERVVIAPDANVNDIAIGQIVVQSNLTLISELSAEFRAKVGETPVDRMVRLGVENGFTGAWIGSSSRYVMGPQMPSVLYTLLQECQNTAQGALYDSRFSGNTLVLRTMNATYAQDTSLTLDYSAEQIAPPLQPDPDDQATKNDVTAKRLVGGDYRVSRETGPLNAQDPGTDSDAVGRFDQQVPVNTATELQLPDVAGWALHLGTSTAERFPKVRVNFRAAGLTASLQAALLDLDIDDRITLTNLSDADYYDNVDLLTKGYTETFRDQLGHEIEFNTAPYEPHNVGIYDNTNSRYDTADSNLNSSLTSSATSFQVDVNAGELWGTSSGNFPMNVWVGGEKIRLSAISGTSSPQTFTVDTGGRGANGVVKAHAAGTKVSLFGPVYYGR